MVNHFVHKPLIDERLWTAIRTLVPPEGYRVTIDSSLPLGRGMGSSAALSVALVRAMAQLQGESITFEEECHLAMRMEKVFHGNPSGLTTLYLHWDNPFTFTKPLREYTGIPLRSRPRVLGHR